MEAKIVRQVSSTFYLLRSLVTMVLPQKKVLTNWLLRTAPLHLGTIFHASSTCFPAEALFLSCLFFRRPYPSLACPASSHNGNQCIYDTPACVDTIPFRLCPASVLCSTACSWRSGKRTTIWTSMCRYSTTRCRTRTLAPSSAGLP